MKGLVDAYDPSITGTDTYRLQLTGPRSKTVMVAYDAAQRVGTIALPAYSPNIAPLVFDYDSLAAEEAKKGTEGIID